MSRLTKPVILACQWLLAFAVACDDGGSQPTIDSKDDKAAEKKAADEKEAKEAERRAQETKKEEERAEAAYQEAKPQLEPLAKLPKKHPKGFAAACDAMLPEYEARAKMSEEEKEGRLRVLRRECHNRPVEVVVCQTEVLKKAEPTAELDHIMRVCAEKFSG